MNDYARLFSKGSNDALSHFFMEFHPALSLYAFRFVQNRETAEDIASMAFVKTWKMHVKLDSYSAIRAYLYRVVRNDCMSELKMKARREGVDQMHQSKLTDLNSPLDDLLRAETYRLLHAAIKQLSPGSARVISMHFIEGKTTSEIAKELKLSESTVKTFKYRGLEALRKKINKTNLVLIGLIAAELAAAIADNDVISQV